MIIKIAGGKDKDGNVLWQHVYSDAIRNRLRRDQNLADISNINEARKNLGIEHVSDDSLVSLNSDLHSYVLSEINSLRVELNSYRINHTDVNINALDSRLTALANKVTSLTMSEVDNRFNTLWDAAKKEIKNYISQLYDASDGTLPDFPSDFNTLHWCGVMSDYPTQPKAGWFVVIKNTEIDNLAYVYTGNQWILLGCTASHDSSGGGGEQPSGGGGESPSGGGGEQPPGGEQPDDDDVHTPDKPKDPFKPENEDQQYRYEYTFKLEPNHPALNVDAYKGTTKTNPRIYRLGLDTNGNAKIFLPAEFSVSGNASAVSQKLYPPETVSSAQAQPTELGKHLVETNEEDGLVKLSITADSLIAIKEDWGVTSITGSLLVLVYDYTNSAQQSLGTEIPVKYVRFIPQESENNATQWALFQNTGSVKTVNIKVPANINANTSTQYWVNDYMPVIADSVIPVPETGCVYLQGLRLRYSNGNTSPLAIASRSTAPLCYLAAALWQTVETVDNTNPAPPSPEPGDHSANATDYDSSFPFLEDLITKVKGSFEGVGTVLLDFVLEKEDSSLRFGKKPFAREYKTRNHYISGHFAMHGNNAVLYLPEDYFDDRYLKGFYCRANCIKYQDSDSKWQEENITNDISNRTELIPFNVNLEHTIINLERAYDEMPPDIGYGVIKIPEETLERIYKEDNVDSMWSRSVLNLQRDFHLLLEYDFGSNSASDDTNTYYTEIKFTSLAFSEPGDYWNSYAQMYTINSNNDKQNFIRYNSVTNIANDLKFKLPYWFKTEDKTALGSEPISCIFKNEYTLGLVYEKTETDVLLSQDFYKPNNMTVWATGNQRAYSSQPNLPASFFCVDYQYAKDNSCIYSLTYPKTQLTYYKKAKPDHYDNASNYDSAFPYLTDLISMIKSRSHEQTNIESVNKWLLDFKLEAEDESLKMGRKAYTVEYKQRNHYVSGHFAMHGNNAVLYLPSDYFDSAYLKNVYIASEDETYCTIYAASSYESKERTIFGTKNQLYPLNVKLSDNVPALVMNKTYADMPPDTGYSVILIPAETLSRIRVSTHYPDDTVESLSLVDTLKLVLEYDFNNAITGKSDNKKVGCINFRLLQNSSFSELTSNKKAGLKPYFTQQENNVSDDYVILDRFMDTVQVMFSYLSPSYYDFAQFVAVNSQEYTAASLYRFELMISSLRKESSHTPLSYEHYTSDTYAISSVQLVTLNNKRFNIGNDAVSNYGFIFNYKYPKDNVFVVVTTVQEDSVNVWGQPEEPDTPSKPDYSDNASYDSSFPNLSSILNNGLSKKKWLLDFPLENHSDNLLKGKKSFIREYKQRNHYISGHFVKHNGNAVIYLPEDYLNSSLLKAVYLTPPPNQHLTVCTEGNFELDVQKTKTFKNNQLVPLDSDEYPLLVSNRSYTDMPPDTGYGVIVIPKSTLHCIQCDWNGTIDDTGLDEYDGLHLVLEYQLNIMPAGASAGGTYGYMRFLPANNAASADTDIEFVCRGGISSENYWLLPDNTSQSNTIITIPELPANTIAHYHNFIYRYEYTFNPGIYVSGSGTASDSGTVLTYNGNLAIQGDIRFAKSSSITYWTGNARAGNPNNISGKLKPYFELQYPTDNVIIFVTTIDLAR